MAYYADTVTTTVINPQFNLSKRSSEFRLPEDCLYTPFLRVLNLGVVATEGSFDENRTYNQLTGVGGTVKNLYLYDDKQVLDQILNFKDFSAFKNYNATNNDNMDVKKNLKKTGLGFVYNNQYFNAGSFDIQNQIRQYNPSNGGHIPSPDSNSTPTGYLDLRDCFPLLKNVEFLSTSVFKKLRVVIEYDVKDSLIVGETSTAPPTDTTVPILLADKVVDEEFVNKWTNDFKGVVWNAVESENVILPALLTNPSNGVQTQKFRLNGFSNKTLTTLLMQNKPIGDLYKSNDYCNNGSQTLINEAIQVYVNGSAVLPDNGVLSANHRLALLTDTFGNCNTFTGANLPGFYRARDSVENYSDRVGKLDYFGCAINKPVTSLELSVSRDYNSSTNGLYKQPIMLQVFGAVAKSIVVDKSGYKVLYI